MTLPELLVSAVLLALLVGIVARFFQIGSRISTEELGRNKAEAVLLTLVTKFRQDMALAAAPGLSLTTTGDSLLIHPVTLSDVGSVVYENRLLLWAYQPSEKVVRRSEARGGVFVFDGTPYRPDPETELPGLNSASDFKTMNLFPGVLAFKIESNPEVDPPFIGTPLKLEVELEVPAARTRKTVNLSEVFHLRNSG